MSDARTAVAVAAVALLLAAALLPAFGGGGGGGTGGDRDGGGDGAGERRGGGGDGVSLSELLEPVLGEEPPDGERTRPPQGRSTPGGGESGPQIQPSRGEGADGSGGAIGRLAELLRGVLGPGNATVDGSLDRPDRLQLYVLGRTVPGERVTLYVVDGQGPAAGVALYVNGAYAGATDRKGRLDVRVPYAAEMNVTTGSPPESGRAEARSGGAGMLPGPTAWLRPPVDPLGAVPAGTATAQTAENDTDANETVSRQFDLPTEANLSVDGEPVPGGTVTLVATVAGRPFRNATVRIDGEPAGRTDRTGRLEYAFGRVRFAEVAVERGAVSGRTRVAVEPVNLTLRGLAVPGQPVTARVTLRGEPVAGVPVRFDGDRVGRTGPDGKARARVPVENRLVVAARTDAGVPVRRVVDWMLLPLVLVPVGAGALAGGARRLGRPTDGGLGAAARARLARLAETVLAGLVAGAGGLDRLAATGGRVLAGVRRRLGRAVAALVRMDIRRPLAALRRLLVTVRSRLAGLVDGLGRVRTGATGSRDGEPRARPAPPDAAGGPDDGPPPEGPRERIRTAWRRVLSRGGVRRRRTLSPGEARERVLAADPDMPRDAVDRLTEAFRAVEYGGTEPDDLLEEVRRAARRLDGREAKAGQEEGSGDVDEDGDGNGSEADGPPAGAEGA